MNPLEESVVFTLAVIILGSLTWLLKKSFKLPRLYDPPVPPGSLGLPFVGETLYLLRQLKLNKSSEFFQTRIKKYGPTFKTHLFGGPTVVVNPPAGVRFLFANHNSLVSTAWPSAMKTLIGEEALIFMQGNKAKCFRHILSAFLGPEAIQRYVGRMSAMIEKDVEDNWMANSEVRAFELVKRTLFKAVFNLFFSLSDDREEKELFDLFELTLQALLQVPVDLPGTIFRKGRIARGIISAKLDNYIAQRRLELGQGKASSTQDLLSILITTKDEDGRVMTNEEIKQNVIMLVIAGHATSSSSLAASLKCIAENPWCYDELRKEHYAIVAAKQHGEPLNFNDIRKMRYTWKTVQESMRLVPPFAGILRRALTDFQLDGYTVPKGWQLYWSLSLTNKNSNFFENPDKFDPERFSGSGPVPGTFTPFGGGPRICPGYEFAKMQDSIFLHHLILRYKWSLLDPNEVLLLAPTATPLRGLSLKLVAN